MLGNTYLDTVSDFLQLNEGVPIFQQDEAPWTSTLLYTAQEHLEECHKENDWFCLCRRLSGLHVGLPVNKANLLRFLLNLHNSVKTVTFEQDLHLWQEGEVLQEPNLEIRMGAEVRSWTTCCTAPEVHRTMSFGALTYEVTLLPMCFRSHSGSCSSTLRGQNISQRSETLNHHQRTRLSSASINNVVSPGSISAAFMHRTRIGHLLEKPGGEACDRPARGRAPSPLWRTTC
ncbi:uncharacterized protein LOC124381492 isoform X2 [Silurus meridionalis]|uniref:uncharacterized protein LOC124381492 isoform X2 n=1 Tax=Silurus meridionalis TaxID=175797 RepID=UPI001EE9F594|nr:uncharacterized protein LOC124381492 isoform X2 [Silurus meridionalis]